MTHAKDAGTFEAHAQCPRCGYDQRGAMATWDEKGSCPLEGTCAECGLTFLWRDVLQPTFSEPRWCVEHAPRRLRPLGRSIVGTFARQWLPWKFWRQLQLQHRVRLRRIAVYLPVVLLTPLFVVYLVTRVAAASIVRYNISPVQGLDRAGLREAHEFIAQQIEDWDAIEALATATREQRVQAVYWSSYRARDWDVEFDELEEVARSLTADDWAKLWLEHRDALEADRAWLDAATATISFGYVAAIAEAVLTPWRSQSAARVYVPSRDDPTVLEAMEYPPPRSLHTEVLLARGGQWYGQRPWEDLNEPILGPAFMWLVLALTYPFTFLLLPITRRRAKVRWIHFARITAYSLTFPILAFCAACATIAAAVFWPNAVDSITVWVAILIGVSPMLLLLAWWYCAIRLHLRLPNALAVTLIMALLNGLLTLGLGSLIIATIVTLVEAGTVT